MILLLLACRPDDVTGADTSAAPTADTAADDTGSAAAVAIEGDWVSTGGDLSPLLSSLTITTVTATFAADGSYAVEALYSGGSLPFAGTYSVDTSTEPAAITLSQTEPYATTAQGIWSVSGEVLTYEVVDLSNTDGYTAPTAAEGFGSTGSPGSQEADFNVQTYRRP